MNIERQDNNTNDLFRLLKPSDIEETIQVKSIEEKRRTKNSFFLNNR